uniref:NADH dehydrogenase subunit 5 n=1 Tax=Paraponera clavata TaxID=55425 RepID=UPI002A7EB8A6|nr:NADH dehydrogenase subunit 5 [Paraponera clavata]WNO15835.1 NADH dehydrogenase subunit 5 [Paraponera clavata]
MNLLCYGLYMYMYFIFLFILSMYMYMCDLSIIMEWLFFSLNTINIEFLIFMDWVSLLFISFVILISSNVLIFSIMYMENDNTLNRFMMLVLLFIVSMIMMVLSPNIVSILLGWDGLGLVSYCLVIYYNNYKSFNSGMVTVLSNRIGDVGLLMCISMMMIFGSWNYFMVENSKILIFMMMMAAMTKSAQIPFSSWLPMAMAAPTPVSALVHSSTLVTAGVYLMIRFNKYLILSGMNKYMLFMSVLTMFMAGLIANFEYDLKKIIALSTLSQLGLMMMILSMNFPLISFYHLLTHALFKSLLFLCAGVMIHLMMNNQDIRYFGAMFKFIPFTYMSFMISSLTLVGFPFLSGFYSKDLIMELIYMKNNNYYLFLLMLISLVFTVSYSVRLLMYLYFKNKNFYLYVYLKENDISSLSMIMLLIGSLTSGSVLNWLYFSDLVIFLPIYMKVCTLIMCMIGLIFSFTLKYLKLDKNLLLMYFFNNMWFMNYMNMYINKPVLIFSLSVYKFDLEWLEMFKKFMFLNLIFQWKNFLMLNNFKIYWLIYMFYFVVFIYMFFV